MWVGWSLTVVFGLLGVYFYLRPRKFKRLEYYYNSVPLIERASAAVDIELLYKGQVVQNPVITQIKVRSTGSEELKPGDFEDDIEIELAGVNQVLTCELASMRPSNLTVQYEYREKSIYCKPLLLNQDDGFDFVVISDGVPAPVSLRSRISGMSQARRVSALPLGVAYGKPAFWPDVVMGAIMGLIGVGATAVIMGTLWDWAWVQGAPDNDVADPLVPLESTSELSPVSSPLWLQILITVVIGLAWILVIINWWRSRRKISIWK